MAEFILISAAFRALTWETDRTELINNFEEESSVLDSDSDPFNSWNDGLLTFSLGRGWGWGGFGC